MIIEKPEIHGIMAEFSTAEELIDAVRAARDAGYHKMDAYSPVPVEELHELLHIHDNRVSLFTLIGGLCGGAGAFSLIQWVSALALPLNIGGRPRISVPTSIPITFEGTILIAGLTAAISMILLNGLPMPYHPVFNVDRFENASRNKFFLCIEAEDPHFDRREVADFLQSLEPDEVAEVAN
ncbi:MAG TPA: DUF3341 domain-containing protein [Bryobacteraceae bacterium]|jgi:hypothetical protein